MSGRSSGVYLPTMPRSRNVAHSRLSSGARTAHPDRPCLLGLGPDPSALTLATNRPVTFARCWLASGDRRTDSSSYIGSSKSSAAPWRARNATCLSHSPGRGTCSHDVLPSLPGSKGAVIVRPGPRRAVARAGAGPRYRSAHRSHAHRPLHRQVIACRGGAVREADRASACNRRQRADQCRRCATSARPWAAVS